MTIKVKIPERRPSAVRLRAQLRAAPAPIATEPARPAQVPVGVPKRPLPALPPLSLGQAFRVGLLALVCLGASQLPQANRAHAERTTVAAAGPISK